MADSEQLKQGKFAILALEERESTCSLEETDLNENVIIEGDELSIVLYDPQRPDRMRALEAIETRTGFRVCDGKICLPHLAPLEVADLTLTEAKEKIQAAYRQQLSHAQIFINFKIQRERQVQVIGAGQAAIAVDGRMRLSEVLAEARIPPSANLFKSYVMRNGQQLPIDLYQLLHEGNESQNIIMQGGDQIFIANETDASVIVTGEIHRSLVIPIPYGSLSLRAALAIAGGIPFTGNKGCIQIIRGDLIRPKIYCLAWKEILLYPNQSLLLMPGDIVVISETPITQWNRFINQLQPSTACMQTGYNLYEIYNQMH